MGGWNLHLTHPHIGMNGLLGVHLKVMERVSVNLVRYSVCVLVTMYRKRGCRRRDGENDSLTET